MGNTCSTTTDFPIFLFPVFLHKFCIFLNSSCLIYICLIEFLPFLLFHFIYETTIFLPKKPLAVDWPIRLNSDRCRKSKVYYCWRNASEKEQQLCLYKMLSLVLKKSTSYCFQCKYDWEGWGSQST